MKLNHNEVIFQEVKTERVNGDFIIYDSTNKKVIMFNKTSSFVWEVILEHKKSGGDVNTSDIVKRIMDAYGLAEQRKQEIAQDIEKVLQDFFDSGLLKINF